MKKTIAVLLSAMMVFGLAGCGNDSEETTKGTESKNTPTSIIMETADDVINDFPVSVDTNSDSVKGDPDSVKSDVEPVTPDNNPAGMEDKTAGDDTEQEPLQYPSLESDAAALDGTWHSVSIGDDGPKYYVEFTDTEIKYGSMEDDKFVEDHADKISRMEKTEDNGFLIQAQGENGSQYTYRTSVDDKDTLEYYGTWEEEAFDSSYVGSSSLMRSMT